MIIAEETQATRSIGIDVHRSFAQVAIYDVGQITESFRVDMEHDAVVAFGRSLRSEDEVILEAMGNTSAIVRLLTPFVNRVVSAKPLQVKAIAHARVKTDKVDAKSRVQAILHANLVPKYAGHLFGKGGRKWLGIPKFDKIRRDFRFLTWRLEAFQ